MSDDAPSPLGPALVLAAAAGLFAVIARRVATKRSRPLDRRVRAWSQARRTAAGDLVSRPLTLLSLPAIAVTATSAVAWRLHSGGRPRAALAIVLTPIAAATAGQSFTTFLAQHDPPDRSAGPRGVVMEPSFPSGHTTGVTAEALTMAYVLTREELMHPALLGLLAAWPVVVGVTRVYRDRHWISDILGGWVAGTGVAAAAALLYDKLSFDESTIP